MRAGDVGKAPVRHVLQAPGAARRAAEDFDMRSAADPDAGLAVALAVNGLPDDEAHRARFERITAAIYEDLGLAAPGA